MTEPTRYFQHYEVLRRENGSPWELGRGAMGITYKAFDVNLCCEVALKVVNSALLDHPGARERFVREARAAAALRHRNVASVYHLGNDGEHFFYAMEFIDGETLEALVRRQGPLPVHTVLGVMLQVAKALAAADRQHLVHRDIKPANLMIVHEDADDEMTIKVIDFGLARPAAGTEDAAQVTLGGFVGTPQYASPEQLEERPLDARSDIYSLGATAWYLVTSRPPFSGSLASVCQQQLSKPPPWEQLPSDLPESMRRLLEHMLAKNPAQRPQDARELRVRIEELLASLPPTEQSQPRHRSDANAVPAIGFKTPPPLTTLAGGRYELGRQLETDHGTGVYDARDHDELGRPVVIRTLPASLFSSESARSALQEEVRLIQAAAHPHLVEVYSLGLPTAGAPGFTVEEMLPGFSLRDLLAARRGALPLADALRMIDPLAATADHAESCRLRHVDFTMRHVRIHFPFSRAQVDDSDPARTLLSKPMDEWPEWTLKVHPFASVSMEEETNTWAGEVTLLPMAGFPAKSAQIGTKSNCKGYRLAVAALTYELLGGMLAPEVMSSPGKRITATLPSLSEAGNAVLSEGLSKGSRFKASQDFYAELAKTSDGRKGGEVIGAKFPVASHEVDVLIPGSERSPVSTASFDPPPVAARPRLADERTVLLGLPSSGTTAFPPQHDPAEDFLQPLPDSLPEYSASGGEGSAWDRIELASSKPVRPGRWVLAAVAVGLVFFAVFGAVLAILLHGGQNKVKSEIIEKQLSLARVTPAKVHVTVSLPSPATDHALPDVVMTSPPSVRDVPSPDFMFPVLSSTPAASSPVIPQNIGSTKLIAVSLRSKTDGVQVRWHGSLLGTTPLNVELPSGVQELVVSYPNGPETHQTLHLSADQPHPSVEIRPMRADLVPLNVGTEAPRKGRVFPNRLPSNRLDRPGTAVRVEPAVPAAPPSSPETVPVRRPLPLEPFAGQPKENTGEGPDRPSSPNTDDDQ